ncbi:MAG: hypothetical protein U0Z26_13125 [Anaerolineales bacterium]
MKQNPKFHKWVIAIILFISITGAVLIFSIWLNHYSSIYVIGPSVETEERFPAWSPDGKYIAFTCGFSYVSDGWDDRSWNNPLWRPETYEVCVVDLATRQLKRLTYGREKWRPFWSPDGRMLLWKDLGNKKIILFDFEHQKTLAKIPNDSQCRYYFWTQDNKSIISECGDFSLNLSTMESSTTLPLFSSLNPRDVIDVHFSPDTKYVASSQEDVLVVLKKEREFFKSNFFISADPITWSPDSSILLFSKGIDTENTDIVEIGFLHVPTKEIVWYKGENIWGLYDVFWSPNGDKIAYQTGDTIEVIEFKFKTNPFSYVVVEKKSYPINYGQNEISLTWSPDEKYIAFVASVPVGEEKIKAEASEMYYVWPKIQLLNLETGLQSFLVDQ